MKVFSFTLFGDKDKYCKGMIRNCELIQEFFTDWECWIWIGDGVPIAILDQLHAFSFVKLINTGEKGMVNKIYRFFAIDNEAVDICMVRDADSRLFERDRGCIQDFVKSSKNFHVIRDHPNHHHMLMACFGIKRGCIKTRLYDAFQEWRKTHSVDDFWSDQEFARFVFYPAVFSNAMIHDDLQNFEPLSNRTRFSAPIGDGLHFYGQVYEFDEHGREYPLYRDFWEGGVHGKNFWTPERLARIRGI